MRISFTEELAALEAGLQEEGDLVLRALRSSLNALARADMELADEVISFDDEVDTRYVAIEEGVQSLLARQTPVAADLRLVLAILRVNLHLERMADYCVTVAKLTKLMGDLNVGDQAIAGSIEDMGQRAEQMIRVALDSFADRDADKAQTLVELDDLIDRANRQATEDVLSLGDSPEEREYGLRMLVISRCVERIGDHAVDIGEQVAYLVTGVFQEFTDASHPEVEANTRLGDVLRFDGLPLGTDQGEP
jgi:phosphate transport system protein